MTIACLIVEKDFCIHDEDAARENVTGKMIQQARSNGVYYYYMNSTKIDLFETEQLSFVCRPLLLSMLPRNSMVFRQTRPLEAQ